MRSVQPPAGTGTVGAAVKGSGWVITACILDKPYWITGTIDVGSYECPVWAGEVEKAAWWSRVTEARAWANDNLWAHRDSYFVERLVFTEARS